MASTNSGCVMDTICAWSIFINGTVGATLTKRVYATGDFTYLVVWFAITKSSCECPYIGLVCPLQQELLDQLYTWLGL